MVTDVGGVNDQSFNQSAWEGLKRTKTDLGTKIAYKESKQDADYAPNLETFTDAEYDLIWGIGFLMSDAVKLTAQVNPDQKYAIVDFFYGPETPKNVACAIFQEEQPSFLVGYIAGKMTKSNKVGFVGGIKFPLIEKFEYGYMAGVKLANPKAEILRQYAESFTDAAKGLELFLGSKGVPVAGDILAMLPYVLTIIILVGFVGKTTAPAAIGKIFDKGDH